MFCDFYNDFLAAATDIPDEFKTEAKAEKYYIHLEELAEKGKLFNLSAITEGAEAIRLHVVDSLHTATALRALKEDGGTLIDVGSGAGFPSLPVAIACDNVRVTALDSTAKKCAFISSVAERCGVGVETVPARAEEALDGRRESFDFACARAVARLNILAELCAPFVKVGGYFLAMKGSAADEERDEAKGAAEKLGLTFERSFDYTVEGGGERKILVYKKTARTPKEFPRRFSQIKKKPL